MIFGGIVCVFSRL